MAGNKGVVVLHKITIKTPMGHIVVELEVLNESLSMILIIPMVIKEKNLEVGVEVTSEVGQEAEAEVVTVGIIMEKINVRINNPLSPIMEIMLQETIIIKVSAQVSKYILCASATETRFSVTAESKAMLYIPLQRNTI